MSSLDLKIEEPTGDLEIQIFHILRDFLQPSTAMTLESGGRLILALLPEEEPLSGAVWSFGEVCIEMAEQIPYYHPSQIKLVGLLEYLQWSTKFGATHFSKVCAWSILILQIADVPDNSQETDTRNYWRYQRLGESLRDNLDGKTYRVLSHWSGVREYQTAS